MKRISYLFRIYLFKTFFTFDCSEEAVNVVFAVDMFVKFRIVFKLGSGVGYKLGRFRIVLDVEGATNDVCFDKVGVCVASREGTEVGIACGQQHC